MASFAYAVPTFYQVSGGSVDGNFSDPGLVINVSLAPGLNATSFTLNDGGSQTFDFFDIWTDETTVNSDDLVTKSISATLDFSDPLTGATVNGITFGGSILFGLSQWGQVEWNGPTTVTVDDRVFSLALSDETFNAGFLGLSDGNACGATVEATITQVSSQPVPDLGDTATLLSTGLLSLGLLLRKKLAA